MYSQPNNATAENAIVNEIRRDNHETIEVFAESARVEQDGDRSRLSAHTLFSSFTAEIIRENTSFTR